MLNWGQNYTPPPKKSVAVLFDNIGPPMQSDEWEYFNDSQEWVLIGIVDWGEIEYRQYQFTRGVTPPW